MPIAPSLAADPPAAPVGCSDCVHVPISTLPAGMCVEVVSVGGGLPEERMKSMGICEGRRLRILKRGEPMILEVYGTRLGLSARLAEQILVRPCENALRCWERMK